MIFDCLHLICDFTITEPHLTADKYLCSQWKTYLFGLNIVAEICPYYENHSRSTDNFFVRQHIYWVHQSMEKTLQVEFQWFLCWKHIYTSDFSLQSNYCIEKRVFRFCSPVTIVPVVCVVGLGLFERGFPQVWFLDFIRTQGFKKTS